jgi:hypothetical protein
MPAPPAESQPFVESYPFLDGSRAGAHGAYDTSRDRWVMASIREIPGGDFWEAHLDLTIKEPSQVARTYSLSSVFLGLKQAEFEIVDLIYDGEGYAVFINKFSSDLGGHWASWVVHVDADFLYVDWAKQIQVSGDPGAYLRVRDAESMRGGYAVVAALGDTYPYPPAPPVTVVARLDGAANVLWSRTYELPREIAWVEVSYGPDGLVVGGWISELQADDPQGLVLMRLETHTGAFLTAAQYEGVVALDDVAMAQSVGSSNTTGGLYVAGRSANNDVTFFPVDSSLLAGTATRMVTGSGFRPIEFVFNPSGDLVAVMQSYFPGDLVLTVPAPLTGGTGTPVLSDLSPMYPADGVEVLSADRAGDSVMLVGYQDGHSSASTDPVTLIFTDTAGYLDSCVPAYAVPVRESLPMVTHYFEEWSQKNRSIVTVDYPVSFHGLNYVFGDPLCFGAP